MSEPAKMCAFIRAKGFYVYTEEAPPETDTETAVWWCNKTQQSIGPDGDIVHRSCCDPSRVCYEEGRIAST